MKLKKKKGMYSRALAAVLSLVTVCTIIPTTAIVANAAPAEAGYTTDANGLMSYRFITQGVNNIDLHGYSNNDWQGSTYANTGYYVSIKDGGNAPSIAKATPDFNDFGNGLQIKVTPSFMNKGKRIKLTYTVKNTANIQRSVGIGATADVKVADDDRAKIQEFSDKSGFSMESNGTQFSFYGKGIFGVDDVTDFWYGNYNTLYNNISKSKWSGDKATYSFAPYSERETATTGFDSVMSWSWKDKTIPANSEKSFSVLLGIGQANERPVISNFNMPSKDNVPRNVDTPFSGTITDVDGAVQNAKLFYRLGDGNPVEIPNSSIAANGNFTANLKLPATTPSGYYTLKIYAIDEEGAPSEYQTLAFSVVENTSDKLPKFDVQPTSSLGDTIQYGDLSIISCTVSGSPAPSIQWQKSADNGRSYGDIAGATRNICATASNLDVGHYLYRCVATTTGYAQNSDPVSITVKKRSIAVSPTNASKFYGQVDPQLTLSVSGTKNSEVPTKSGDLVRAPGEAVGSYEITRGTLKLESNAKYKASNYNEVFTTGRQLTITRKPAISYTEPTPDGKNGWFVKDFDIVAPTGYTVSTSDALVGNTWADKITVNASSSAQEQTKTFYFKDSTGAICEQQSFKFKMDKEAPTALSISYNNNWFYTFLNTITFGRFFLTKVNVVARATDTISGGITYQYFITDTKVTDPLTITEWKNSLTIDASKKGQVYVKATDLAGNFTINYEGVVIYKNAQQDTKAITFTRTTTADVPATVKLNGNTIKEIKLGANVIAPTNYSVDTATGVVTFKASYLNTVPAKDTPYTLTISYNPMGETFNAAPVNEAPSNTTIALTVSKADQAPLNFTSLKQAYNYGDKNASAVVSGGSSSKAVVFTSSNTDVATVDASTGKITIKKIGTFTITATKATDDNYKEIIKTSGVITVNKKEITIIPDNGQFKIYGDAEPSLTYNMEAGALETGDSLTGALTRATGEDVNSYEISKGTLANSNYNITVTADVQFIIKKAELTATAEDKTSDFGQKAPTFTVAYTGFKNGETKAVLTKEPTATNTDTDIGEHDIAIAGGEALNYEFKYVEGKYTINEVVATAADYEVTGEKGENDWLIGDITIKPKAPYTLIAKDETYANSIVISEETANETLTFTMRKADGSQCSPIEYAYKLDKTAPEISGIDDKGIYFTDRVALAKDENLDKIVVTEKKLNKSAKADNETPTPTEKDKAVIVGNVVKTYTVEAKDLAGHTLSYEVQTKTIGSITENIKGITEKNVKTTDKDKIKEDLEKLKEIDTKDATKEQKEEIKKKIDELEKLLKKIKEIEDKLTGIIKEDPIPTSEKVTKEDKTKLIDKVKKIDELLKTDNLTPKEREDLEKLKKEATDRIKEIDEVLAIEKMIKDLPNPLTAKDKEALDAIEREYGKLSDHQKSLVDASLLKQFRDGVLRVNKLIKEAATAPTTGDSLPIMPLTVTAILALLAVAFIILKKKKAK